MALASPARPRPMRHAVRARRALLLLANALATALSLLTGLRENALVALATGRFDAVRARLKEGRISYAHATRAREQLAAHTLPDLARVADEYEFHRAPTRSPATLGEDRSTCLRVHSMNATVFHIHFDDAFGKGPRREQVFVWSISAPHCEVLNLDQKWLQRTRTTQWPGNATACDAYILDHFQQLKQERSVQAGVPVDFGVVGVPYLKCKSRPTTARFQYLTDLMVFQSFWAGGSYQVEFQTSVCWAIPVAIDETHEQALFRVQAADMQATVAVAVPSPHWVVSFVSSIYSAVYLAFLARGVLATMATGQQYVTYIPAFTKRAIFGAVGEWVPSATIVSWFIPSNDLAKVFRFQASSIVAANMWLNQWVYISLSIIDSCLNVRSVYMMLTMGAWMLTRRVTLENFLFMCAPLTKMAWITCLAHTIFQRAVGIILNALRRIERHAGATRYVDSIRWYFDSVALFTTFKFYTVTLVLQLYIVLIVKGSPTISTRAPNPKRPVYGGFSDVVPVWLCEIVVDLFFIVLVQILVAHVVMALLLLTKLRRMTHNRLLRVLQHRYVFVGWDVFVTMDALGIEPFGHPFIDTDGNEVSPTNCSAGALLRQLLSSGPSGWVQLAGENGLILSIDDRKRLMDQRSELTYPLNLAVEMGLLRRKTRSRRGFLPVPSFVKNSSHFLREECSRTGSKLLLRAQHFMRSILPQITGRGNSNPHNGGQELVQLPPLHERIFRTHVESLWGSLILVDFVHHPVRFVDYDTRSNGSETGRTEHDHQADWDKSHSVAVHDALRVLSVEDCKRLLNGELRLHMC